jgi:hypothetical protein
MFHTRWNRPVTGDPDFDHELTKSREGRLELARRYEWRAQQTTGYRRDRLLQEARLLRCG